MNPTDACVRPPDATATELDDFVRAFEEAHAAGGPVDLAAYLPERSHPCYARVLRELVRVDMEYGWQRGAPRPLDAYVAEFPELAGDPQTLADVAFEEYRQRRAAGAAPLRAEYEERYGVCTASWVPSGASRSAAGRPAPAEADRPRGSYVSPRLVAALAHTNPRGAQCLVAAADAFPEPGSTFAGFRLLELLGTGAFGRVFLAEQGELAGRHVALKVAPDIWQESQTLARLQHTHIVPVYSVHRSGPFQAVCMPYFGSTTLTHVLRALRSEAELPASGKILVSTVNGRKSVTRLPAPAATPAAPPVGAAAARAAPGLLERLEGLGYVEAVLWLGARLADGLAHAHDRGIFHLDLKPANVLLGDDGQPMLLDFNLALDRCLPTPAAAALGGTLPYMAPEHLDAYRGGRSRVDGRSDLYALGLLLYELLTRRHPFWYDPAATDDDIARMIAERQQPPPRLRVHNPAVAPAAEAIVRKCLESDPGRRYQSAHDLREDLERQLAYRPLRHAANPSRRERVRKWARRHPRLASASSVGVMALFIVATLATSAWLWSERVARLEAHATFAALNDDVRTAQALLYARNPEPDDVARGAALCRAALNRYQVTADAAWEEHSSARYLAGGERERLRDEVGELCYLVGHASLWQARHGSDRESVEVALNFNHLAADRAGRSGPALTLQRAELAEILGDLETARQLRAEAARTTPQDARDFYLAGHAHAGAARFREAVPYLERATQQDPRNFAAWFVLGNCREALGQDADAIACFSACVALRPDSSWPWYDRGLVHLRQRQYRRALADFDEAVRLRPDHADAYINRALAWEGLNDYRAAVADLDEALRRGTPRTRVYFMRALAKRRLGDAAGARRDTEEGLRQEPQDEQSWVARGLARSANDPRGALADFEQALALNPRSVDALQNKANILAERLNRTEEAVKALDEALAAAPDFVPARAGRGVLLARLGRYDAARTDAREALTRDAAPPNQYQVAGIYALCSRQDAGDRVRALQLVSAALRTGFGLDLVDHDTDLDPIRNDVEFGRMVTAARALRAPSPRK